MGEYEIKFQMYDSGGAYTQLYKLDLTVEGDPEPEVPVIVQEEFVWNWKDLDIEDIKQPVPSFKKLGIRGLLEIKWDQDMRRPKTISEVESGTVKWTNKFGITEEKPILEVKVIPGMYTNPAEVAYRWNITRWEDKDLHIQIWFNNPDSISVNEDPEKIRIVFYGLEHFVSEDYRVPVNGGPDPRVNEVLYANLPEQYRPVDKVIAETQEVIIDATKGTSIVFVVFQLLTSYSVN